MTQIYDYINTEIDTEDYFWDNKLHTYNYCMCHKLLSLHDYNKPIKYL